LGFSEGGFADFLLGGSDPCREARREREEKIYDKADAIKNQFLSSLGYTIWKNGVSQ
jgi:hypothetical protein